MVTSYPQYCIDLDQSVSRSLAHRHGTLDILLIDVMWVSPHICPQEALRLLKEGNARFVSDTAVAGNITEEMRQSLVKDRKWMKLLDSKFFF